MANQESGEEKEKLPLGGVKRSEFMDRVQLLSLLSRVIQTQEKKITKGRIRDPKNERLRLDSIRCLAYICNVANSILRDKSFDEIEERLTALESKNDKNT